MFVECDGIKMSLNLIADSRQNELEDELIYVLMNFQKKMLEKGNLSVKKAIYDYFYENTKSEQVFAVFYFIIYDFMDEILKF